MNWKILPAILIICTFYLHACNTARMAQSAEKEDVPFVQSRLWRVEEFIFHLVDSTHTLDIQCNEFAERRNFYQYAPLSENWEKPALRITHSADSLELSLWDAAGLDQSESYTYRSWSLQDIRAICFHNLPFAFSEVPVVWYPRLDLRFSSENINKGELLFQWVNPKAMEVLQFVEIIDAGGKQLIQLSPDQLDPQSKMQRIALPANLLPGKYFIRVVAAHDQWSAPFFVLP